MRKYLQSRWFLAALVVLIGVGLPLGMSFPAARDGLPSAVGPDVARFLQFYPRLSTWLVLFLMAFTLDSHRLRAALRAPGPVVWASFVNLGVAPLLAWPLVWLQLSPDFQVGLMIAASVPCTMAAASVWTRKARGNDAVSLMVTLATNGLCFLVTPFWLNLALGGLRSIPPLDGGAMILRLVVIVLLPTVCGQLLQALPRPAAFAARHKIPLGVAAQALMLSLIFLAAFEAGTQLGGDSAGPGWPAVLLVWGCCIAVHMAAMGVAVGGASLLRMSRADRAAVAFAGSQKTLPIGVLLATDPAMYGDPQLGLAFAVFPMLMFHATQLFTDTAVADRMAAR